MQTMSYENGQLRLLDQTKLPTEESYIVTSDYLRVAEAIRRLEVRGAPAIGLAAAFAICLGLRAYPGAPSLESWMERVFAELEGTRPTAVNLFQTIARFTELFAESRDLPSAEMITIFEKKAAFMLVEDERQNRAIGQNGLALLPDGVRVLTHCNAGALATGTYGTALGIIRAAREAGKLQEVYATETRPLLQGARLTAWELGREGIPVTLITDSMAGYVMALGRVDAVITGADRIAMNGDTANKIGTYALAVLAAAHGLPFYIAAPRATLDDSSATAADITVEERDGEEVRSFMGVRSAPPEVKVFNPAFDITPARLITAIITDQGVATSPFTQLREFASI
jgi:methylthioribose-1-phosphate isomerase